MANEVRIVITADDRTDRTFNAVERKVKTSFMTRMRASMGKVGTNSGAAFTAGFLKTITFGQVGSGFAQSAIRSAPSFAKAGGVLGGAMAAGMVLKLTTALTAALPLAVGGAMLALPIAGIIKKQLDVMKDIEKIDTKILTAQDKVTHSRGKAREEAEKELKILKEQKKELEKQAQPLITLRDKAKHFMDEISKPVRPHLDKAFEIIGNRLDQWAPKVKKAFEQLAPVIEPFTKGVLDGIEEFFKAIGKDMPSIKEGMKAWGEAAPKIGKGMGDFIAKIMKDPKATVQAVQDLANSLVDLAGSAADIVSALQDAAAAYEDFAKKVDAFEESTSKDKGGPLGGMAAAMERGDKRITDILKGLRGRFVGWIKRMWGEAKDSFVKNHSDILSRVKGWVGRVVDRIGTLPSRAKNALKSLAGKVGEEVEQAKDRAISKVKDMVTRFVNFVKGIPGKSKSALSSLSSKIGAEVEQAKDNVIRKARDMVTRFIDRMQQMVRQARDQAGKIKGAIVGKFSGAGRWLYGKGKDVIDGLLDGLKNKFDAVKKWVSGIASWIKKHKGPIELDRRLLVPEGKALMGGLLQGLKFGFGGVGDFVYKAGTSIKDIIGQIKSSFLGDFSGKIGSLKGGSNKLLNAIRNTFGIGGGTYPGHGERGAAKAWDFMARGRTGDLIASFAKTFARQLGVMYVIWNRRIWSVARASEGWRPYTRYGSNATPSQAHTNHVHVSLFDKGGMLRPGGLAMNLSGRPERILSPGMTQSFDRLVRVMGRGGGGVANVHQHFHFDKYIGSKDEVIKFLSDAKRQGRLDVILR